MRKKINVMIILVFILTLTTGCWDKMEVKEIVIAVGLGIDKVDDKYRVSVQVVNPNEIGGKSSGGGPPVTVYKGTGTTIFEAIRKLTTTSARKIYFSHLRIFVIGEETARNEGIGKIIEFVSRDHEFRADFDVIIAKNIDAVAVLESLSDIEKIPAQNLHTTLNMSSKEWASTSSVKIDDIIDELMTEGSSPVITGIQFKGSPMKSKKKEDFETTKPEARLEYEGMAVFKKDKLIGWLDEEESKGYNYALNKVNGSVGSVSCPNQSGNLSIEVLNVDSDIHVTSRNDKTHIQIKITGEGNINEVQCEIDLSDPEEVKLIEIDVRKKIDSYIHKAFKKEVALKTDFMGLGASIYRTDPKLWNSLKGDWSNQLRNTTLDTKIDFHIRVTGKIKDSFINKIKE